MYCGGVRVRMRWFITIERNSKPVVVVVVPVAREAIIIEYLASVWSI